MTTVSRLVIFGAVLFLLAGDRGEPPSKASRIDRIVSGSSVYPVPVDVNRVGTYPAGTYSGAGYFYDEVLEYRVWLHPERGATPTSGGDDYFVAFAQYERAEAFAKAAAGAEQPLVLVRQLESINEPEPGRYIVDKTPRITEWQARWLLGSKRGPETIKEFLKHPRPARN
jgi:hypothetical protein